MSWSIRYESREKFEADEPSFANGLEENEAVAQGEVARAAAEAIIASGKVGAEGKDLTVYLNGHANPDHEPRSGYANDTITVTVTQKSA